MGEKKYGALNEQGYFGSGFGFTEATEEEKDKLENGKDEDTRQ